MLSHDPAMQRSKRESEKSLVESRCGGHAEGDDLTAKRSQLLNDNLELDSVCKLCEPMSEESFPAESHLPAPEVAESIEHVPETFASSLLDDHDKMQLADDDFPSKWTRFTSTKVRDQAEYFAPDVEHWEETLRASQGSGGLFEQYDVTDEHSHDCDPSDLESDVEAVTEPEDDLHAALLRIDQRVLRLGATLDILRQETNALNQESKLRREETIALKQESEILRQESDALMRAAEQSLLDSYEVHNLPWHNKLYAYQADLFLKFSSTAHGSNGRSTTRPLSFKSLSTCCAANRMRMKRTWQKLPMKAL